MISILVIIATIIVTIIARAARALEAHDADWAAAITRSHILAAQHRICGNPRESD